MASTFSSCAIARADLPVSGDGVTAPVAITDSDRMRPRSVVTASVSPSAYQARSVSPERFANGSTASDRTRSADRGHARPGRAPPEENSSPAAAAASAADHTMERPRDGAAPATGLRTGSGSAIARACTSASTALVSADGSVSSSVSSCCANAS